MDVKHRTTVGVVRTAAVGALVAAVVATLAGCGGSDIDAKTAARARAATDPAYAAAQGGGTTGDGVDPSAPGDTPADTPGGDTPADTPGSDTPADTPGNDTPSGEGGADQPASTPGKPPSVSGASCAGFKNGPGITDKEIRIGNASDISGPVPGLFTAAQEATKAFVTYFNNSGARICGRKLALDLLDSKTDAGADQVAYARGCEQDFAMVGSMSSFDSGGARTAEECGIPDVRAISTTVERGKCKVCFAAQPAGPDAFQNAVPDFVKRHSPSGGKKAAMLYINIGAAAANGKSQQFHEERRGLKFVVSQGIDVADFNYSPYVQKLKSEGADSVQFIAASPQFARLSKAFRDLSYDPKVYLLDPSAYNNDYPQLAGATAKGTYVFINFVPFEEAASNGEMRLYTQWLRQVSPGAEPTFFGVFAWSSARLFVEQATRLGGRLNRANLIGAMKKVDNWTSGGIHAPQHVGSKKIADCWRFLQWSGSAWKPVDGTKFQCRGLS